MKMNINRFRDWKLGSSLKVIVPPPTVTETHDYAEDYFNAFGEYPPVPQLADPEKQCRLAIRRGTPLTRDEIHHPPSGADI